MKLNKASLFALIATLELAESPGKQISTADISAKYGISSHHLAKIMRNLVYHGLAHAARGVGGGYRFAGNARRTTLLDIIQLFEPLESVIDIPVDCITEGRPIIAELTAIGQEIDALTRAILETITLETALKSARLRSAISKPAGDVA